MYRRWNCIALSQDLLGWQNRHWFHLTIQRNTDWVSCQKLVVVAIETWFWNTFLHFAINRRFVAFLWLKCGRIWTVQEHKLLLGSKSKFLNTLVLLIVVHVVEWTFHNAVVHQTFNFLSIFKGLHSLLQLLLVVRVQSLLLKLLCSLHLELFWN